MAEQSFEDLEPVVRLVGAKKITVDPFMKGAALLASLKGGAITGRQFVDKFKELSQKSPDAAAVILALTGSIDANLDYRSYVYLNLNRKDYREKDHAKKDDSVEQDYETSVRLFKKSTAGKSALTKAQRPSDGSTLQQYAQAIQLVSEINELGESVKRDKNPPRQENHDGQEHERDRRTLGRSTPRQVVRYLLELSPNDRKHALEKYHILSATAEYNHPLRVFGKEVKYTEDFEILRTVLDPSTSEAKIGASLLYLQLRDTKEKRFANISNPTPRQFQGESFNRQQESQEIFEHIQIVDSPDSRLRDTGLRRAIVREFEAKGAEKLGAKSTADAIRKYVGANDLAQLGSYRQIDEPIKSELLKDVASAKVLERGKEYVSEAKYIASIKTNEGLLGHFEDLLQRKLMSQQAGIMFAYKKLTGEDLVTRLHKAVLAAESQDAKPELRFAYEGKEGDNPGAKKFIQAQGIFTRKYSDRVATVGDNKELNASIDAAIEIPKFIESFTSSSSNFRKAEVLNLWLSNRTPEALNAMNKMISFYNPRANTIEEFARDFSFGEALPVFAKTLLTGSKTEIAAQRLFLVCQELINSKEGVRQFVTANRREFYGALADILDVDRKEAVELSKQFNSNWLPKLSITGQQAYKPRTISLVLGPNNVIPKNVSEVLEYASFPTDAAFYSENHRKVSKFREMIQTEKN